MKRERGWFRSVPGWFFYYRSLFSPDGCVQQMLEVTASKVGSALVLDNLCNESCHCETSG